ncbi:MAG: DeoR/GlpR family DNA-binding transcription regulator [Thermoguttaceae bacterium]|nr:DeoR/GlpR family DNA-binding transcription regulator [Thermoguttaceae bacterium]
MNRAVSRIHARHRKIQELIAQRGECTVEELSRTLGVSGMTIRRDLQALEQQGQIVRTHGGATLGYRTVFEFDFLKKLRLNLPAKEAIARTAAELLRNCSSVMLDGSTTTLAIARHLRGRTGLTVITTSLPAASELQHEPGIDVLLPGGYLRPHSPDLTGPLTEKNLEELHAEVAIMGADAIDEEGYVYTNPPDTTDTLLKMAASADRVYIAADSSKFGRRGLRRYGRLTQWQGLITDNRADPTFLDALRKLGVQIFVGEIR